MKRGECMGSKVVIKLSLLVLTILVLQLPALARAEKLTVMTRNLYLGADLSPIVAATSPEEFLAATQVALGTVAANNFPARAEALAAEIAEKKPHLVGLQEVFNYTLNGWNLQPPFRNYLDDLMAALEAEGVSYRLAAEVVNMNIRFPVDGWGELGVMDRDVILAREDVETEVVDLTGLCRQSLDEAGIQYGDGCNYQTVIVIDNPLEPDPSQTIAFARGFVAVDTKYGRFFNTHLEVQYPDPANLFSSIYQSAQAYELLGVIEYLNVIDPSTGLDPNGPLKPVIVVGDFNSSPDHPNINGTFGTPYQQFENEGYLDTWSLRPGKPEGYTCCYDEYLDVPAELYERIDMIFTDTLPDKVKANVVGNENKDSRPSGLYPSDHAGVVSTMEF
jgi:endonuclease/exonuclease/phosphatase family metal-dependent hydrolase